MAWIRTALVSAILLASATPMLAQQDDGPVPPVYVPEEQQDNVPSGPPAVCQGRNCLPPGENPVQQCEGQDCTPEPLEESE
jgi:hypothetical protein